MQVKKSRARGGLAGPDGTKSVFGQLVSVMATLSPESLLLSHRIWKVKFVGESVSQSSDLCDDLSVITVVLCEILNHEAVLA